MGDSEAYFRSDAAAEDVWGKTLKELSWATETV